MPTLNPRTAFKQLRKQRGKPSDDVKISPGNSFSSLATTLIILLLAPAIAFLLTAFVVQSYQVDGQSMETTLQNNDRLIVDKVPRTLARITKHDFIPNRGDIIIFNQNNLPGFVGEKQLIKRVVGLPGDRVVIQNGTVRIYNSTNPNGFNPDATVGYKLATPLTQTDVNIKLEANQIFVCGDNRSNSEDSRYFGPINANQVVGKLVLRLLPVGKIEKF